MAGRREVRCAIGHTHHTSLPVRAPAELTVATDILSFKGCLQHDAGMGDKGGKKDKEKNKQQQLRKQKEEEQKKQAKSQPKTP